MGRNSIFYFRRLLSVLTIVSVAFTQAFSALRLGSGQAWALDGNRRAGAGQRKPWDRYGCLALGWRSCRQTMNTATNPNRTRAATGINAARSLMINPPLLDQSSGVNHVPTNIKSSITMPVPISNFILTLPVTSWPIRTMEMINSALRPNMAARYFRFASLNLTNQVYHASKRRATLWR